MPRIVLMLRRSCRSAFDTGMTVGSVMTRYMYWSGGGSDCGGCGDNNGGVGVVSSSGRAFALVYSRARSWTRVVVVCSSRLRVQESPLSSKPP